MDLLMYINLNKSLIRISFNIVKFLEINRVFSKKLNFINHYLIIKILYQYNLFKLKNNKFMENFNLLISVDHLII